MAKSQKGRSLAVWAEGQGTFGGREKSDTWPAKGLQKGIM